MIRAMTTLALLPFVLVATLVKMALRALVGAVVGIAIIAGVIFVVGNSCDFDPTPAANGQPSVSAGASKHAGASS